MLLVKIHIFQMKEGWGVREKLLRDFGCVFDCGGDFDLAVDEIINLTMVILENNYFEFNDKI